MNRHFNALGMVGVTLDIGETCSLLTHEVLVTQRVFRRNDDII